MTADDGGTDPAMATHPDASESSGVAVDLGARYWLIEQLWTGQDWDGWAATTAPGYRFDPGIGPVRDLNGTLDWSRGLFRAFPDLSQRLEHVIVTGRTVVGVAVIRGIHTGPLDLGLGNALEPTGSGFELPYVKVIDFDMSGRAVNDRQYLDAGALLRQLLPLSHET